MKNFPILTLIVCFSISFTFAQETQKLDKFVQDELLIWLEPNVSAHDFSEKLSEYGLSPKRQLSKNLNIWLFSYTKRGIDTKQHFSKVRSNSKVRYIQNNHIIEARSPNTGFSPLTPNDPQYANQWGMDKIYGR